MREVRIIDSLKNPLIKHLVLVKEKSKWRKKHGEFVLEGKREVEMSLKGGCELQKVFFRADIISIDELSELMSNYNSAPELIEVSQDVYRRIAYREKTEGIVALGHTKAHDLASLQFRRKNPLVMVAESLEKPGNIGAILRTADAAALDAVIISNPKTDLYNPNIIRSSLGCVFTIPIGQGSNEEVKQFLKKQRIQTFAAELNAKLTYSEVDLSGPAAIVVGAESTGLTDDWILGADQNVLIPMQGEIDSMNVSVSAAILIFEAMRQRDFR